MSRTSVLTFGCLVVFLSITLFLPFSLDNDKKWIVYEINDFLLASCINCDAQQIQRNTKNILDIFGRQESSKDV